MKNLARLSSDFDLSKGWLFIRNIPLPTVEYEDFSIRSVRGAGGEAGHGYARAVITWTNVTSSAATWIREKVEAVSIPNRMYATVPLTNASGPGANWADIAGFPHPPVITYVGEPSGKGDEAYIVELTLNNVVIVNSPSEVMERS